MPALNVTRDVLERYRDHRLTEGASNATVNREMGLLKRAFRISKLTRLPLFPRQLAEHNRRSGFIEDSDYVRLSREAPELWLRLFLELAFSYGWRKQELLSLRVRQVNILSGTIYLNAEQSKNGEPREVSMTLTVLELMKQAIGNKGPDDYVLTRENGSRVKDFRKAWRNLCVRVGLGSWVCRVCEKTATAKKCECGSRRLRYRGRIVHDFRRSAARLLRRAGVPQSVIMEIGGWKTDSMFRRYAIVSHADHKAAVEKLEQHRLEISQQGKAENSHDFSHDLASTAQVEVKSPKARVN